jgi:predicted nucleic acid-binding Zn ribbon protein
MADHVAPVSFQDGVLLLQAESTAWATQVRLLLTDLRRVVEAEVGVGVVTSISVVGPTAPSWIKGPRTVKGRGPRDTYG